MPLPNQIIIASAGAGKTTHIVKSLDIPKAKKSLVVTYTLNNEEEIRKKFFKEYGFIPSHVKIKTWFSFLLDDFVRPYQSALYPDHRVDGLAFVDGISTQYIPESNIKKHYFSATNDIYSDKIAKFGVKLNQLTNGFVIQRLEQIYDTIYVDEVQDLAAWDLDVLDILLNSKIKIVLVGDPRQATYKTNNSSKYSKYSGVRILKKFKEWRDIGLCELDLMNHSYRCNQEICNFADRFFPDMEKTESRHTEISGHDGIFIVRSAYVNEYIGKFSPKILRYNRREKCMGFSASNYKESKGLTFQRVLIFPHNPLKELLKNANFSSLNEPSALYVAVTRARYSVGIVYDAEFSVEGLNLYKP